MYKYKIMIIDDEIAYRIKLLTDFFTNKALRENEKLDKELVKKYEKHIAVEFEVVYPDPNNVNRLDTYIENNSVDAYFLDVYLDGVDDRWSLAGALRSISKYNPNAPIFVYSNNWQEKEVLDTVTDAFRESFAGRTPSYYYDLKDIDRTVTAFREANNMAQIDKMKEERMFIKEMINKAAGKTTKVPFSDKGDVAILHISDIQIGDQKYTEHARTIWKTIADACENLKVDDRISGIDLLAITGDISMHGKHDEFNTAKEELEEYLIKRLWPREYPDKEYQERILLVPGNHDYDLNFCTLEFLESKNGEGESAREIDFHKAMESLQDDRRKRLYDYGTMGFDAYRYFAYNLTGNEVYFKNIGQHLNYEEDRFSDWNLKFLCLNSCDGIKAECTNGVGFENRELSRIVNDHKGDCYTIILSHHTPLYLERNPNISVEDQKTFKMDCMDIMNLTQNCQGMWMGGHFHSPDDREVFVHNDSEIKIYEAATASLDENWDDLPGEYQVTLKNGKISDSRRGFQIIVLKNTKEGYEPNVIRFFFDKNGNADEAKNVKSS